VSDLTRPEEQNRQAWPEAGPEEPQPEPSMARYRGAARLEGRVALISGGHSGLGRAIAVGFAKEGADVAITYLDEHEDAQETVRLIEAEGRQALAIPGDIGNSDFTREVVRQTVAAFGRIDLLVNNAAEQHVAERLEELTDAQLERTFRANIFSQFFLTRSALPEMPDGSAVINTAASVAFNGDGRLLDYASSKAAVVAFTRSLSRQLKDRRIRVNAVAPGSVRTSPEVIAPAYVFLASREAAYFSGQVLHPDGGEMVEG
jgi:NAD(P)-dependent dehydrogenase (short-subunit alcohol dehydrogenase family)